MELVGLGNVAPKMDLKWSRRGPLKSSRRNVHCVFLGNLRFFRGFYPER